MRSASSSVHFKSTSYASCYVTLSASSGVAQSGGVTCEWWVNLWSKDEDISGRWMTCDFPPLSPVKVEDRRPAFSVCKSPKGRSVRFVFQGKSVVPWEVHEPQNQSFRVKLQNQNKPAWTKIHLNEIPYKKILQEWRGRRRREPCWTGRRSGRLWKNLWARRRKVTGRKRASKSKVTLKGWKIFSGVMDMAAALTGFFFCLWHEWQ